jgi:hypothetical protein
VVEEVPWLWAFLPHQMLLSKAWRPSKALRGSYPSNVVGGLQSARKMGGYFIHEVGLGGSLSSSIHPILCTRSGGAGSAGFE